MDSFKSGGLSSIFNRVRFDNNCLRSKYLAISSSFITNIEKPFQIIKCKQSPPSGFYTTLRE